MGSGGDGDRMKHKLTSTMMWTPGSVTYTGNSDELLVWYRNGSGDPVLTTALPHSDTTWYDLGATDVDGNPRELFFADVLLYAELPAYPLLTMSVEQVTA